MVKNTVVPAFIVVSTGAIATRAYEIYVERGCSDGFDREDWLRAERELNARAAITPGRVSTNVKKRAAARDHPRRSTS